MKTKTRQKLLLLLFSFSTTILLHAQEKAPKSTYEVGASIGLNSGWFKDLNFSPIHYTQSGLLIGLDYRKVKISNGNSLLIHLDYSPGKLDSSVTDFLDPESIPITKLGNAKVTWLKPSKWLHTEKMNLSLGANYHFFVHYVDFDDGDAFTFFGNHSLGISGQLKYQFSEKSQLYLGLDIPIFNLIIRPPYNSSSHELEEAGTFKLITDGHLGTFNNLIAWDFQLRYALQLSDRMNLNLTYLNRFQYLNDEDLFRQMQNQLYAGITFQL